MQKLAVVDFEDVLCERRLDWSKDVVHWKVFINMFKFHRIGKFLNNLIEYLRLKEGYIVLYTVRHWVSWTRHNGHHRVFGVVPVIIYIGHIYLLPPITLFYLRILTAGVCTGTGSMCVGLLSLGWSDEAATYC